MRLIQTIKAVVNSITTRRNKMSSSKNGVPAIAGIGSNGQLTFNGEVGTTRTVEKKHYTVNNIGKRIWNPLTQSHVDNQEFYKLAREEKIFLNELTINRHVDDVRDNATYKFNGTMSEIEWLAKHGLELRANDDGKYMLYETEYVESVSPTKKAIDAAYESQYGDSNTVVANSDTAMLVDRIHQKLTEQIIITEEMKDQYDVLNRKYRKLSDSALEAKRAISEARRLQHKSMEANDHAEGLIGNCTKGERPLYDEHEDQPF